jgi:GT2 family glycosyltransferase
MPVPQTRSSTPSVTVIVLNYNGEGHLKVCLPSLEALDYPNTTLMVADNGSSDGSLAYVRGAHPRVRVAPMGANLGFSKAYNRAVPQTDTDYVVLLNNDTRVASDWLTELVEAAERHQVASAASSIIYWDGSRIDFVGGLPTAIGHSWQIDYGESVGGHYPERRLLFGCGGSVLIRRDAYLEAGGFDEDFFASHEDVDLSYRARLLGYPCLYVADAVVRHHGSGTLGRISRLAVFHGQRNLEWMYFKNTPGSLLVRTLPGHLVYTAAAAVHFTRAGLLGTFLRAKWSALVGLPGLLRKRAHVQRTRRVGADAIWPHLESKWLATKRREKKFDLGLAGDNR